MPPPGLSIGVGSDDEDNEVDVSDAGAPPSLALNTTMAGMVLPAGLALGPDSDDDSAESTSEIKQKLPAPDANAYELSKTGAFKLADFQLRPEGGLTVVGGSSSPANRHTLRTCRQAQAQGCRGSTYRRSKSSI